MALLSVAVGSSVFVVGRLIFRTEVDSGEEVTSAPVATELALGIVALIVGAATLFWFVVPFLRRNRPDDDSR